MIVFLIAACLAFCLSPPCRGHDSNHPEFLVVGSALVIVRCLPMKGSRNSIFKSRMGQQVPGNLRDDEFVVGNVAVECIDHPIAIRPDSGPFAIGFIPFGICVPGKVQPQHMASIGVRHGLSSHSAAQRSP